jgi:iron(III) transport system substrate-binding protein
MIQAQMPIWLLALLMMHLSGFIELVDAGWEDDWSKALNAASKEGKVAVAGAPGKPYRDVVGAFEKKFPNITLEYQGFTPADFVPRFYKERQANKFLWDIYFNGPTTFDVEAKKAGDLLPLRPVFILPEVADEKAWYGGFQNAFLDKEKQFIFSFQTEIGAQAYINRELVSEKELNSVEALTDPKWKGKIAVYDPRIDGAGNGRIAVWIGVFGEEFVKSLLKQDVGLTRDRRQLVEWVVRGKYPIGVAVSPPVLYQLQQQGVGSNVKPLGTSQTRGAYRLSSTNGVVRLINKSPHPNAATVFVNWLLSKEGQTVWVKNTGEATRRLELHGLGGDPPKPGGVYFDIDKEEGLWLRERAKELSKEVLGN